MYAEIKKFYDVVEAKEETDYIMFNGKKISNDEFDKLSSAPKLTGTYYCVLCQDKLTGYGHNPHPKTSPSTWHQMNNRCCGKCNTNVVMPLRRKSILREVPTFPTSRFVDKNDHRTKDMIDEVNSGKFPGASIRPTELLLVDENRNVEIGRVVRYDGMDEFIMSGDQDYCSAFAQNIEVFNQAFKTIINSVLTDIVEADYKSKMSSENLQRFSEEQQRTMKKMYNVTAPKYIPQINVDMIKGEYVCPIVFNINKMVFEWQTEIIHIHKKRFDEMYDDKDMYWCVTAKDKEITKFCREWMRFGNEGKNKKLLWNYLNQYHRKHEYILQAEYNFKVFNLIEVSKMELVQEEKVVTKSKSQLKKEKVREANKRREQEKIEKKKREEKEAKYLEQKRKEAERKRIAVCRAKRK